MQKDPRVFDPAEVEAGARINGINLIEISCVI